MGSPKHGDRSSLPNSDKGGKHDKQKFLERGSAKRLGDACSGDSTPWPSASPSLEWARGVSPPSGMKAHPTGTHCFHVLHCQDDPRHSSGSPEDTPRSSGASGIFDLRNLAADSLLPSLLERTAPDDVDRRNEVLRRQHRPRALLALYPAPDEVGASAGPEANTHPTDVSLYVIPATCTEYLLHTLYFYSMAFIGRLSIYLYIFSIISYCISTV